MQRIKPFLWFKDNAEEAVDFYLSVFPGAKRDSTSRVPEGGPGKPGSVMIASFILDGVEIVALNGGPHQSFTDAISLMVPCDSQAEIDDLWEKMTVDGGQEVACGWLRDKFGVPWQITPANMGRLLAGKGAEGAQRAMAAMMQMKKLDIAALERAGGLA